MCGVPNHLVAIQHPALASLEERDDDVSATAASVVLALEVTDTHLQLRDRLLAVDVGSEDQPLVAASVPSLDAVDAQLILPGLLTQAVAVERDPEPSEIDVLGLGVPSADHHQLPKELELVVAIGDFETNDFSGHRPTPFLLNALELEPGLC